MILKGARVYQGESDLVKVKSKLFGLKKEEYIGGRKLTGEFLADVQYLSLNYSPKKLKKYLREAREKYLQMKEYGKLFTKLLFAYIMKIGAVKSYLDGHQIKITVDSKKIEELARELCRKGENPSQVARNWEKSLYAWITNLYAVGDFYPGYGWSSFISSIDRLNTDYQKKKEGLSQLMEDCRRLRLNVENFIFTLKSGERAKRYKPYIEGKPRDVQQNIIEKIVEEMIEERDKLAIDIAELKYKIEEICEEIGEKPQPYTKELEEALDLLYKDEFYTSCSELRRQLL